MPPIVINPANGTTHNGSSITFDWTDGHLGHNPVGAVNWRLKVGTSPNGFDACFKETTALTWTCTPPQGHRVYYVKVEYQKVAGGPWYSSATNSFTCAP